MVADLPRRGVGKSESRDGDPGIRRETMNKNSLTHLAPARGITLVEILLIISLLAILAAFALPAANSATARSELKAVAENVQYSVETARNVARMTESAVSLDLPSAADDTVQTIRFSHPDRRANKNGPAIQEYQLPEGIRLVSDRNQYVFDSRGLVEKPGSIQLVSLADDSISTTLRVD